MVSYVRPVTELIRARRSWRTYQASRPRPEDAEQIRSFIAGLGRPPFGSRVRIVLAELGHTVGDRVKGTYGVISGARSFLVGAMDQSESRPEDFGYLFESVILCATSLGYATCWVGGTFDRTAFADAVGLAGRETVCAVSPVGVPAKARSTLDRLFAATAGSHTRKPFAELFFMDDFESPMNERSAGSHLAALEMVRLAPSSSNRQPWRVLVKDGAYHFYLRRTPLYSLLFTKVDLQRLDMGIAMFHLEQTLCEQGVQGSWRTAAPSGDVRAGSLQYVASFVP